MKNIITIAIFGISLSVTAQDLPHMDGRINWEKKGDFHYDGQAYTKALKAYEQALKKNPEDSLSLHLKLANVHRVLADNEVAEQHYRLALNEDPSKEDALNFAEFLAKKGNYEEAKSWLDYTGEDALKSALVQRRKAGFEEVATFYDDSLAYTVKEMGFNSPEADFSPLITADGLIFVSGRSEGGMFSFLDKHDEVGFLNLYQVKDGVAVAMGDLNTSLNQGPVALLPDGRLVVTSNYPKSVKNADRNKETSLKLELFELKDGEWILSGEFPYNDKSYSVGHPAYDPKRNCLYFASNMPEGYGGVDLYRSEYQNGEWKKPENMGSIINTEGDELFPFYDSANGLLYYSSNGYAGLGGLDLCKVDMNKPQRVINLGYPANSEGDDFGIALDADGKSGYISSNRKGGQGKDDIYELKIHRVRIESRLVDANTGSPVAGSFQVIDEATGQPVSFTLSGDKVVFDGIAERNYRIVGTKEGYETGEVLISASSNEDMQVDVSVQPAVNETVIGIAFLNLSDTVYYEVRGDRLTEAVTFDTTTERITVGNVYFDLNSYDPGNSTEALDELFGLMNEHNHIHLELKAYADSRGRASYNHELAAKRADGIVKYLVSQGISEGRISKTIIGEHQLINECRESVPCSEELHGQNRRVEFYLRGMQE